MNGMSSDTRQEHYQQGPADRERLYRLGLRLAGNPTDANYLVQETFRKAYAFWDYYEHGTDMRVWLGRILKDSFITMYRKRMSGVAATDRVTAPGQGLALDDWLNLSVYHLHDMQAA